jgi:hypothetical protein
MQVPMKRSYRFNQIESAATLALVIICLYLHLLAQLQMLKIAIYHALHQCLVLHVMLWMSISTKKDCMGVYI